MKCKHNDIFISFGKIVDRCRTRSAEKDKACVLCSVHNPERGGMGFRPFLLSTERPGYIIFIWQPDRMDVELFELSMAVGIRECSGGIPCDMSPWSGRPLEHNPAMAAFFVTKLVESMVWCSRCQQRIANGVRNGSLVVSQKHST